MFRIWPEHKLDDVLRMLTPRPESDKDDASPPSTQGFSGLPSEGQTDLHREDPFVAPVQLHLLWEVLKRIHVRNMALFNKPTRLKRKGFSRRYRLIQKSNGKS